MQIRPMTMEDCSQVAAIEAASFSMPWSIRAFEDSIGRENYRFFVVEENGEILGYCGFLYVLDEGEIPNVCVKESARQRGIGRQMMEVLLEAAKNCGLSVLFLEVRESNRAARRLYESLGFIQNGMRKNFYEQPTEDAILMMKML